MFRGLLLSSADGGQKGKVSGRINTDLIGLDLNVSHQGLAEKGNEMPGRKRNEAAVDGRRSTVDRPRLPVHALSHPSLC
jgi:hypothetical protein